MNLYYYDLYCKLTIVICDYMYSTTTCMIYDIVLLRHVHIMLIHINDVITSNIYKTYMLIFLVGLYIFAEIQTQFIYQHLLLINFMSWDQLKIGKLLNRV